MFANKKFNSLSTALRATEIHTYTFPTFAGSSAVIEANKLSREAT